MEKQTALQAKTPAVAIGQFRSDIVDIYLFYARNTIWVDKNAAEKLFPGREVHQLMSPDWSASELGLTFEHLSRTDYAMAMARLYDFAYFGRADVAAEAIAIDGSTYSWATALTFDVARSRTAEMWLGHGVDLQGPAQRILDVAELANARATLEGEEHFFRFRESDEEGMGGLTIRQFALLADMKEMSVRAAANPNRPNSLKTYTEKGRTLIKPSVAKEWLRSKGRYMSITRYWGAGDIDLIQTRFNRLGDLEYAVSARLSGMEEKEGQGALREKLSKLGFKAVLESGELSIKLGKASDQSLRGLAELAGLDPHMFLLRVKEVIALEQLAEVRRELDLAVKQKPISTSI